MIRTNCSERCNWTWNLVFRAKVSPYDHPIDKLALSCMIIWPIIISFWFDQTVLILKLPEPENFSSRQSGTVGHSLEGTLRKICAWEGRGRGIIKTLMDCNTGNIRII